MSLLICPSCGHRKELAKVPRKKFKCGNCGSKTPRIVRRMKWWMKTKDGIILGTAKAQRQTYSGLQYFAQMKGYKPGWASIKFKVLFGDWPPRGMSVEPAAPSSELIKWITKQQAIYSTARRAERKAAATVMEISP